MKILQFLVHCSWFVVSAESGQASFIVRRKIGCGLTRLRLRLRRGRHGFLESKKFKVKMLFPDFDRKAGHRIKCPMLNLQDHRIYVIRSIFYGADNELNIRLKLERMSKKILDSSK